MTKVVIDLETLTSAKYLKNEIEKVFPLLEGKVRISKKPEVKYLDELIKELDKEDEIK